MRELTMPTRRRLVLAGVVFALGYSTTTGDAQAMYKRTAASKTVARAERNCHDRWARSCPILGVDTSGPHENRFGRVQWFVHVWVEGPHDSLWEQYRAYDAFGNVLASSFLEVPISQN